MIPKCRPMGGGYRPVLRRDWRVPDSEVCDACKGSGSGQGSTGAASSSHGLTEYVQCSCCNGIGRHCPSCGEPSRIGACEDCEAAA